MTSGLGSARVEVALLFETDHQGRCYGRGETEQRPGGNGKRFPTSGRSPCVSWSLLNPLHNLSRFILSQSLQKLLRKFQRTFSLKENAVAALLYSRGGVNSPLGCKPNVCALLCTHHGWQHTHATSHGHRHSFVVKAIGSHENNSSCQQASYELCDHKQVP